MSGRFVLTLSCADAIGIVHAVSGFLVERRCNIVDSAQYLDPGSGRFFMRVAFEGAHEAEPLRGAFGAVASRFAMRFALDDAAAKPRLLVLVSKQGHCLNDLLFRQRAGDLAVQIVAVVSNHPDLADLCAAYGVPFIHLPVTPATKAEQETAWLTIAAEHEIDLVVLARYMQILSEEACAALDGRAINIHHSFLPGFKGANPYRRAYERGVKLIGATAHYVTGDLDEGPIIEQDVARVEHGDTVADLVAIGREIESRVLSRAVKLHVEHRVLRNGPRTVLFR